MFLPHDDRIIEAPIEDGRAIVQKSVFRREPLGVIPETEYDTKIIPKDLKIPLQMYLAHCHNICPRTMFPDFTAAVRYVSSSSTLSVLWDVIPLGNRNQ